MLNDLLEYRPGCQDTLYSPRDGNASALYRSPARGVEDHTHNGHSADSTSVCFGKDAFLRYGLLLVSEGMAGELLEEILSVLLYVSDLKGIDFLRQCVAAEAILSIANGEDEDTLLRKLLPYCGIDEALTTMTKRKSEHAD